MPGTSIDRLMRATRTIIAVPVIELGDGTLVLVGANSTTCPMSAPTSAVLDSWRQVVTSTATGAGRGGNISCALLDDVTLGFGESETDDELTICSIGNEVDPLFANAEIELSALRDKNFADTGVFNLATQLLTAADTRYALIDRHGYKSTDAFAAGQIINLFDASTDNPVDVKEDRGNLKVAQSPSFNGNFLQNYTLAS